MQNLKNYCIVSDHTRARPVGFAERKAEKSRKYDRQQVAGCAVWWRMVWFAVVNLTTKSSIIDAFKQAKPY